MLEGQSYLISRALPSSCEQVTNGGKRRIEEDEGEESGRRQLPKQLINKLEEEVTTQTSNDFHLSPSDQHNYSKQHANGGDQSDSTNLIQSIGQDMSVNCLIRCSRSDHNSLALVNKGFHDLIRGGNIYKLRREGGVIEHWVYFSCHLLEWEAFDPNSRRWMHVPRMPSNDCFMCSDKESLAVGTDLLVFGKEVTSHVIWSYSLLINSWSSGMTMNSPRCLFGSASLGETAILAGCCDSQRKVLGQQSFIARQRELGKSCQACISLGRCALAYLWTRSSTLLGDQFRIS